MKIFIDGGHRNNKADFGATGSDGTKESLLALQVGKKLKVELEKLGHTIQMSRTSEEEFLSLGDRVKKANNFKADLYISIHINSATNKDATGFECLCYPSDKNRVVAKKICDEVVKLTGQRNRGQKDRDDLYVLNATDMDSYLVECGFISNEKERDMMKSNAYQDKVVAGIIAGLGFKKEEVKPTTSQSKDKTLMIIDGAEVYVESVLIDGNNFIKLRDLDSENIDVMYDSTKKCAIINTKCKKHNDHKVSP